LYASRGCDCHESRVRDAGTFDHGPNRSGKTRERRGLPHDCRRSVAAMVDVSDWHPACTLAADALSDTRMVGCAARIDDTAWRLARAARSPWRARNDLGGRCAPRPLEGSHRLFQAAGHTTVDGAVPPFR